MKKFNNDIIENINGLIILLKSKGFKKLSIVKFLLLINKNYRIELDQNSLSEILSNNKNISELSGDQIILGTKDDEQKEEMEMANDNVKKEAEDEATNLLKTESVDYKSVFDKLSDKTVGKVIDLNNITLNESLENYHLLYSIKKNKAKLDVIEIMPKETLSESFIKCKVKDSNITVDIPLYLFKKG